MYSGRGISFVTPPVTSFLIIRIIFEPLHSAPLTVIVKSDSALVYGMCLYFRLHSFEHTATTWVRW